MKKRLISILLTLLMVMSLFSGMSVSAYADDDTEKLYVEYTLAEGDYVLRICQKLGINYYTCKEAIMAINNITSENGFRYLSVGEVVKIPVSDAAAIAIMTGEKPSSTGTTGGTASGTVSSGATVAYYLIPYTMQRGETVLGVCNSLGISFANYADQIMKLNGISSWNKVNAGTTLLLPTTKTPAVGTTCYAVVAHKVASGDTAYTLCQKYGVSYGSSTKLLQALNNTDNLAAIKTGKNFYLPVATTIKAQSSTTTGTTTGSSTTTGTTTGSTTTTTTAKSYDITSNINTNYGSMAFYVNNAAVSSAKEGDVVSVNVTTKDNKAVESLVVKYADGRADVKLEANSFIMPACDVRVDANIKSGNSITINSNYSFKTAAQVGGVNVSSASTGSSVKIVSTDPGFAVKEVEAHYSTLWGMKKEVLTVNDQFCFVMPNKDVTVNVTLAPVTTYSFFRADPDHGSFDIQVDGSSVSKAAKGSKVTIIWQAMSGWDISEINVYKADKNGNYNIADKINVFNNSFTMPGSPVYVEVKFECTTNYISIDAVEGGKLVAKVGGVAADEAETNETVVITGEAKEAGYNSKIKEIVVTRKADGHRVSVTAAEGGYSFKMPAGGVDISGKLESVETNTVSVYFNATGSENRVTLKAEGYDNWSVLDNDSGASNAYAVGTRISLSTLARDSHAFTKYMVYTGASKTFDQEMTDMANAQDLLVMPNANVIIEAYFSADVIEIEPATIVGSGVVSYKVGGMSVNSCKVGDTVEIVAVPSNKVFQVTEDCITVINNATEKALTVTKNAAGNFEFQMPAEGVTISVRFNEGTPRIATLLVRPYDNDADFSLQGKSLVEARIYDGYNPIVENNAAGAKIETKGGEAIVLYLTAAAEKYDIDRIKVESTNSGTVYEGGLEYVSTNKYRVWVEDDDLSITVYLKLKSSQTISLSNVSWDAKKGSVGSTVGSHTGAVVSSAKVGDIVYIVPEAIAPYFVDENSISIARKSDGGAFTLGKAGDTVTDGKVIPVVDGGKVVAWGYKMPEGGVTAHVEFKSVKNIVTLNVVDTKGASLKGLGYVAVVDANTDALYEVTNDEVLNVEYGYPVKIVLTTAGAQMYKLKSVTVPTVEVNSKNWFWMPEYAVTAEVVLEELNPAPATVKFTYSANDNNMGKLEFYGDGAMTMLLNDEAEVGKDVYIKALMKDGYKVKEISVKNKLDNTEIVQAAGADWKFTMPEEGVTIKVVYEAIEYTLTIDCAAADDNRIQVKIGNSSTSHIVKKGDTLTVAYNTNIQFSIYDTNFKIVDMTTTVGGVNTTTTGTSVKMPASDMSVNFTLAAK